MDAKLPRALGPFTAVALGLNAIVGSGIYLFPHELAEKLGPLSVLAFIGTALACAPIALAYAELARDHDRSGGTYRYAAVAFGPRPGALLGFASWVTAVLSWGAVANAVPAYLGHFVPALGPGLGGKVAAAALVVSLTLVNLRGVVLGAGVSNTLTVAKLVPLLPLAAAGIAAPFLRADALTPVAPHGFSEMGLSMFRVLFAYQGFEVVGIAAGEMRNAPRDVRRGVLWSVSLAALLYVAVQLGYLAAGAPGGDAPLANAAGALYGSGAATLLAVGGLASIVGFNAGTAVGSPRYLYALAEDGWLPTPLARLHAAYRTPVTAILVTGVATLGCTLVLDFDRLVDLANVSVLFQYLATSVALVVLRPALHWRIVGVLASLLSVALLTQATLTELGSLAAVLVAGAVLLPLLRVRRRVPGAP